MRSRRPPTGGAALERLAQRWLEARGWTVHRAGAVDRVRTGSGWVCRAHDLFGALDLLAIRAEPLWLCGRCRAGGDAPASGPCACGWYGLITVDTLGWQLTTRTNRASRRRKVEAVAWPRAWRVSVVTCTGLAWRIEDLVDGRWRAPVEEAV